jgi:carnitine 3-dehydrogenase
MSAATADPPAVAVAGAGVTGSSWAGLFAAAGLAVRLYDTDPSVLGPARLRAQAAVRFLAGHGLADAAAADAGLAHLISTADPEAAFTGVAHVQECVREEPAAKRELFALAGRLVPPEALIATSSSGLSISAIQTAASRPERCLAAHPYNPPHLVPLVELAPGALTSAETMASARRFFTAVGKEPVVLACDIPGYLANRLSAALWREAIELVRRGVVTVEDVDRAVSLGPGLRWAAMGPHLIYELGGGPGGIREHMRHLTGAKEGMLRDLASWTAFPSDAADALESGIEAEKGGRGYEELCRERDELLAALVIARRAAARRVRESGSPGADPSDPAPDGGPGRPGGAGPDRAT